MQETILNLIKLQSIDDKIKLWQRTAAEGPTKLTLARKQLTDIETELKELNEKFAENRKRRRELDAEIADLVARRATNQSRQLRARNNDEYRAILKEAETIATMLTTREDELLLLMDIGEKMEARVEGLSTDRQQEETIFSEQVKTIESILADNQQNEATALIERSALISNIAADVMSRYRTVARNRAGQAMSPVKNGQCQGCRLSIPPQLFNELQKNDKLLVCPNCARIMYWVEHPYFHEFLGEPEPAKEATENRRGRKPKTKTAENETSNTFEVADKLAEAQGAAL
ncbi:MAG: C4-type zinc ribbon domain-containing protein [Deltaproteobacteria bacterium]|nr:C4-type zinc ribbon domain-containing protein [Deltaproteobacteria bacterium]